MDAHATPVLIHNYYYLNAYLPLADPSSWHQCRRPVHCCLCPTPPQAPLHTTSP